MSARGLLQILLFAGGCAVAGLLLWHVGRGLDLAALREHLSEIRPAWLVASLAIGASLLWVSALEWRIFLPAESRPAVTRLYRLITVMTLLQNTVHHFAGHGYALYQLLKVERVTAAGAAALLALDQTGEGCAKLGLLIPLACCVALPGSAGLAGGALAGGVALLLVLLVVLARLAPRLATSADATRELPTWRRGLAAWAVQLSEAMRRGALVYGILLAVSKKFLRAGMVLCIQWSLGLDLPWYTPLLVVAAIDLATLVAIAPGHLGVFEAAAAFAYRSQGLDAESALLAAILFHAVSLAVTLLPGMLVLAYESLRRTRQNALALAVVESPAAEVAAGPDPSQAASNQDGRNPDGIDRVAA